MLSNRYYSGPANDHFAGDRSSGPFHPARFTNIAPPTVDTGLADVLRWRRTSQPAKWPAAVAIATVVPERRVDATRITLVGHATVLIQTGGLNLVTDPVWSARASPFAAVGPQRVCPPAVGFDDLPTIDAVLLSHNHYDHLDIASLRRLVRRDNPRIITPLGNDTIVRRGIADARVEAGDWWDQRMLGNGVEVSFVPAQHWSARGVRDRRMALWSGFYLRAGADTIYFAGDTGFGDGSLFATIAERLGSPDVALLPIGAYAPRWFMRDSHIDPAEAVEICQIMGAGHALAIHWGVFQLSDEGRGQPAEALAQVLAARGFSAARFTAPEPGHVFDLAPVPGFASTLDADAGMPI